MARGKCGRSGDARKRFAKGERRAITIKTSQTMYLALVWLADAYGLPLNETFELLVRDALAARGKSLAEFDARREETALA